MTEEQQPEATYDWNAVFDERLDELLNRLHKLASENRMPMVAQALRREDSGGRGQHSSGITLGPGPTPPTYFFYIAADKLTNPMHFLMSWRSVVEIAKENSQELEVWEVTDDVKSAVNELVDEAESICRDNGIPLYIDVCFASDGTQVSDRRVADFKPKTGARVHYQNFFGKLGENANYFNEATFEELQELLIKGASDSESLRDQEPTGSA